MRKISRLELDILFGLSKYSKLIFCIVLDLVGMVTFAAPGAGDITDVIWAFIHIALLKWMLSAGGLYNPKFWEDITHAWSNIGEAYKSWSFWEELLPITDIVPSACLSWYKSYFNNGNNDYQNFLERMEEKYLIENY